MRPLTHPLPSRAARLVLLTLLLTLLAGLPASLASPHADASAPPPPATPVVAKVHYGDKATLNRMGATLDVWTVAAKSGYAVVLLQPEDYAALQAQGLRIEIDTALTAQVNAAAQATAATSGIPNYPCYRTVEETYTTAAQLAANYPNLVTWTKTGESWDKVTAGAPDGYDLYTLVLTNRSMAGPKPKFYLMAAIHAREYATAELATRFVEKLVNDYGVDADTTWLIDNYELHAVLQVNPDGRKKAEAGQSWRKNTDSDDGCKKSTLFGTDLNRNSTFKWNTGGSTNIPCDETYHGPTAGSEPEVQHVESYMANLFGDHRGPGDNDPAPATTEGVMITLHSYGNSVLYPWGWSDTLAAPNDAQLATLGRKFGFYNQFEVCPAGSCYYIASGGTDDYAYGALGVPGYTFEVGTSFFQDCSTFESDILPRNLPALKYAFKTARRPYQDPAGPEAVSVAVSSGTVNQGASVTLTARADDTRYYSNGYGNEPSQNVTAARYTIDTPSWKGGTATAMTATDGAFNSSAEDLTATINTTNLSGGKHIVFVEAQDANGQWGVPTAVFLTVNAPCATPQSPATMNESLSGANVTLTWSHLTGNSSYQVWRSDGKPYFMPGDAGSTKAGDVPYTGASPLSFTDNGMAGDPNVNHFWLVAGANSCGTVAAPAARSGEFDYNLVR